MRSARWAVPRRATSTWTLWNSMAGRRTGRRGWPATAAMRLRSWSRANPVLIPRNHRIEEAIAAGVAGDFAPFERLHAALAAPFDETGPEDLRRPPEPDEEVLQTFCGT